ncbi:MAG: hypothetical protein Q7T20_14395 [Saprospiraceae bacterium]|nr:hypothetical protein [Saprospiraceae bacterium]
MKRIYQLISLCFLITGAFVSVQGQDPCLRITTTDGGAVTESNSCATTLTSPVPFPLSGNAVNFHIYDNPRSLNATNLLARYKAFWIFGDGNFAFFPHQARMEEDLISNNQSYNYHLSGKYTARAVLSEKKSNDEPPKRTAREIEVINVPTGSTFTPFKQTISGTDNTLDLFNSEVNRPKHPTAFVVSAPKLLNTFGMFFFYNSSNASTPGKFTPFDVMIEDDIELPWYMKVSGISAIKGLTSNLSAQPFPQGFQFKPEVIASIAKVYRNYIFIDLNPIYRFDDATGLTTFGDMPVTFNEFRFFPVLTTTLYDGTLPLTRFAAISLIREEAKILSPFFTSKRLANLEINGGRLLEGTQITYPFIVGSTPVIGQGVNPIYLGGVQILDVVMKASIDPNKLEVLKICPKENGQYELHFRAEVCNQGYMEENAPQINISDPFDLFQNFQFEGTVNTANFLETAENTGGTKHNWSFTWNQVLGKVPEPGDPESDFQEQCAQFSFTATTNWDGVLRVKQNTGLRMCVVFSGNSGALPECHYNGLIDSTKLSVKYGYQCGDTPPPTPVCSGCGLLCILLIIILVAILIWWLLKGKSNA